MSTDKADLDRGFYDAELARLIQAAAEYRAGLPWITFEDGVMVVDSRAAAREGTNARQER